ncbi:hypothetical protein [Kitasatospora sp. CB01950]|uniref:hypothetical protein n=1 Tax=Kitasatospora sp. CB01950 TaxID=1703930 RepID=UPI00093CCE7E|nr:hypothetical protein [Kitasatospora sp. CB01950]OKJ16820.1 hypothetical protein AMK19_01260 [Kitasatospora sp. CB01950]
MDGLTSGAVLVAVAEKTERSPLLYAWWALQLGVLVALGWGAYRLVRAWRGRRAGRDAEDVELW